MRSLCAGRREILFFLCFVLASPGDLEITMIKAEINNITPSEASPSGMLALFFSLIYDVVSKPITVKEAKKG